MCSFPNESLCLGLQWCTQAGYPWQIKPGLQCLCFVLLFLFPHFSKAVHASETANACFNTFRLPLWGTAAGPSYDSCLLVLTTSQDVTVWAVCSCHIYEGKWKCIMSSIDQTSASSCDSGKYTCLWQWKFTGLSRSWLGCIFYSFLVLWKICSECTFIASWTICCLISSPQCQHTEKQSNSGCKFRIFSFHERLLVRRKQWQVY